MSTDKVSGDSRFDAGMRELAEDIEHFLGLQNCTKPVRKMIADRLRRRLLPLLEKVEAVLADEMMKRSLMPVETWYKVEALRKELDTHGGSKRSEMP